MTDESKQPTAPAKRPPVKVPMTIPGQRHGGSKGPGKTPTAPPKKVGRRRP